MACRVVPAAALWTAWAVLALQCVSCASAGSARRRREQETSKSDLLAGVIELALAVSESLNERFSKPPPSNSYSYESEYGPEELAEPLVVLRPTEAYSAAASTDCSGWVSFVLNTVSPLHEAVLQSQRHLPQYNRSYDAELSLQEGRRPWSRAFVLAGYFRSSYAEKTGFAPVPDLQALQAGDIAAYATGRYVEPSDAGLTKTKDTGHTFIVLGSPRIVHPRTPDYDGQGTLSARAVKVIAVAVIDSSSVLHFDPDARENEQGAYSLPQNVPFRNAKPGGVGTGTIWLALDGKGRALQRRLGPTDTYADVAVGAVRLQSVISLEGQILDEHGDLVVDIFDNSPSQFAGVSFGRQRVRLTGKGGIRLVDGRLVLSGRNDFSGGVTVDGGELVTESEGALGVGDVEVRGGSLTLRRAALHDGASLRLSGNLATGAIRLELSGEDIVRNLQLGDTLHRCGTFGAPGSGAMFTDPVFSGSGLIRVQGGGRTEDCKP